ncbi:MAG: DNA primase [Alphaproteobacteria bacterium]|nr:DNA primase [Alphaproteobacteria bacterium]
MSIPPRFLDEIRSRLSLSDIIGKRVKVTRAGREHKACCPFHREKTPSFTINDDKGFYHCFGCGAHGDVIGFVMQHDNLSFIDAVGILSAEAGLQMPAPDPAQERQAEKSRGLYELMDEACAWFTARLQDTAHEDVLTYLEKRGLEEESRARFRIGFAPADGQALRAYLQQAGFRDEDMIEAGVIKPSAKGGAPYAFFRDRVMFPVTDRRGRVVAFGGRTLPEDMRPPGRDGFKPPKYINSSDTPLFDKGRMLYAESIARQAAREGHSLIVTEGYMDVIACHSAGFKGAVAPMGTALTEEQILSLWSMMEYNDKMPILCFDGDNAGRRAASRACERILPLLKPGKGVRFAFLPEGEDPDSLLRSSGRQGLQAILASSLSLFDFLWAAHTTGRNFDTPESRAGLDKDLQKVVSAMADTEIQRHYKALIRSRISEAFFKPYQSQRNGGPSIKRPAGSPASGVKIRSARWDKTILWEKVLLAAVLNHPYVYPNLDEDFGNFPITSPRLNALRQKVITILEEEPDLESPDLQHKLRAEGFAQEIDDILNESVYVHAAFCKPDGALSGAVGSATNSMDIGSWFRVRDGLVDKDYKQENRQGWRQAVVQASSEDDEEKLKSMMRARTSEEL